MQIAVAIKQASQRLVNSDSARLDAEILLSHVLECPRSYLYSHPEFELKTAILDQFQNLIGQRCEGHPVAHLTGEKEFWSIALHVTKDTLIPRPETERLVEAALSVIADEQTTKVLDLGTGTGAIAIAIATERPDASITATDNNDQVLTLAKQNAERHQINTIKFVNSDWFQKLHKEKFDVIVSNPPYISKDDVWLDQSDVRFEARTALISDNNGLQDIQAICQMAGNYLKNNAWLLLEHGHQQGKACRDIFINNGFNNINTIKDYSDRDRVCMGQWQT